MLFSEIDMGDDLASIGLQGVNRVLIVECSIYLVVTAGPTTTTETHSLLLLWEGLIAFYHLVFFFIENTDIFSCWIRIIGEHINVVGIGGDPVARIFRPEGFLIFSVKIVTHDFSSIAAGA